MVLVGITFVSFATVYVLPGDPITARYPQLGEEERRIAREQMGLSSSLPVQYVTYMRSLVQGDLGFSYNTGSPVAHDLQARLGPTFELVVYSLMFAILVAVPLGIVAGARKNRWVDHVSRLLAIATLSIPVFWSGLVAIFVFFYLLDWAPAPVGRLPLSVSPPPQRTGFLTVDSVLAGEWSTCAAAWQALALPVAVLGLSLIAPIARITRSAVAEALQEKHVLFARAIGVGEREVILRDAFRGAQVALLTVVGYTVGYLIAGTALVEEVFSWPGMGRYSVQAVVTSDQAAIQAVLLVVAVGIAITNLCVDIGYAIVDPRIRHGFLGRS